MRIRVIHCWQNGDDEQSIEPMQRCRRIVSELLGGIKKDGTELSKKVSGLYLYLFRTLTEAQLEHSEVKMNDVVQILDLERTNLAEGLRRAWLCGRHE